MNDVTRSFVNVAVFAPIAFYGLRGKEPPFALIVAAGAYTLAQFLSDLRTVRDAAQEARAISVIDNGSEVSGIENGAPRSRDVERRTRKRTKKADDTNVIRGEFGQRPGRT